MTADPEITCHEITPEDEFVVLACDGIWDCLSSEKVVDIVRHLVSIDKPLCDIPGEIFDICLRPKSPEITEFGDLISHIGEDNMTMVLVVLLHGRTEEEWYEWVKGRVDKGREYTIPYVFGEATREAFKKRVAKAAEAKRKKEERKREKEKEGVKEVRPPPVERFMLGGCEFTVFNYTFGGNSEERENRQVAGGGPGTEEGKEDVDGDAAEGEGEGDGQGRQDRKEVKEDKEDGQEEEDNKVGDTSSGGGREDAEGQPNGEKAKENLEMGDADKGEGRNHALDGAKG
jgi:protein phosphatase PTC2/3